jgi:hypothetical protein
VNFIKNICPASACFPGKPLEVALQLLHENKPLDLGISNWDFSQIQICPQHIGTITPTTLERVIKKFPKTQFRLHANVRVENIHRPFDAGFSLDENIEYVKKLKQAQEIIQAQFYSYHAPMRHHKSWQEIKHNIFELQDFLNIPVALEGLYPNHKLQDDDLWANSLEAYQFIYNNNIFYALDLSHVHIAYAQANKTDKFSFIELTKNMLKSNYCLEIHVSSNDGLHDSHKSIQEDIWWKELLNSVEINPQCTIFCESLQR